VIRATGRSVLIALWRAGVRFLDQEFASKLDQGKRGRWYVNGFLGRGKGG